MSIAHPASVYLHRRQHLLQQVGDGVVVLATAPERQRNADAHYPYRFDSNFYYLTGFTEPEAVVVLDGRTGKSILFCRSKHEEREIWDGFRYGPAAAAEEFAFDEAHPIEELANQMPTYLADRPAIYYPLGQCASFDRQVLDWLDQVRSKARLGIQAPSQLHDLQPLLAEMRLFKDEHERTLLRQAARISAQAHRLAMQASRPGRYEYEIEAVLLHHFVASGARAPAYESIVASGKNACVLHYVSNRDRLRDGELLLIDAGCEYHGYAGDITRTFPINGRFTPAQRAVYDIVLASQQAAIAACQVGASWDTPANAALTILVQGLIDLGLLQGSVDGNIESESYKRFYMHRIGHWLGLDVHDVGAYKQQGAWRPLQAGMVTTIEPGLYIRAGDGVPTEFANIGIRIEDDVLITEQGHEVLTAEVPTDPVAIETLMATTKG